MDKSHPPIFVTGAQRSGTTLLHQILNSSEEIWSKNEMWPIHPLVFGEPPTPIEDYQKELSRHLDKEAPASVYQNELKPLAKNFGEALARCAKESGKERWVLKDTRLTYFLPDYAREFPDAKFVIMVRDPRAVCNSYLNSGGFRVGRPANAYAGACRWKEAVELQCSFANENQGRVFLVRYEDLITEFPETVSRVTAFLEVERSDSMLEYYKNQPKVHAGNENIRRPPDPSLIDKWKNSLSLRQKGIIETVCRDEMKRFSYSHESSRSGIGSIERGAYTLQDIIMKEWRWKKHRIRQMLFGSVVNEPR